VQSLRACVRGLGSEDLRSYLGAGAPFVAQIVAEVAEVPPDAGPLPPAGAEAGRFRLFDAVATFLRNAGAGQPLMLVLDDLHAADAPSILLLRFVARELGDARVLVLGAYRPIELDPAQTGARPAAARAHAWPAQQRSGHHHRDTSCLPA
jgi:predicted ATPase